MRQNYAMQRLPIIDLAAAESDHAALAEVAAQIAHACDEIGVFQLTGHGVPAQLLAEQFAVTRRFFARPNRIKAAVRQPVPDQVRGWSGVGSEGISYSLDVETPGDLKEKFDIGPIDVDRGDPSFSPDRFGATYAPNLWPNDLPELRVPWETTYQHLSRVANVLMKCCAVALNRTSEFFDPWMDRPVNVLRALYYPPQQEPPLPGQLRAGVHCDYGTFTLITGEAQAGGLQVLDRTGAWIDIPTSPSTLTVLVGDLLSEWTGNRWAAPLHRVVNPPRRVAAHSDRLAFAFYANPNPDTPVDGLGRLSSVEVEPGYDPHHLTAGDHAMEKYVRQTSFGAA